MNERQKRFVDFYLQTGNATDAARRAGYSERTAESIGSRLLRNVKVAELIQTRLQALDKARVMKTEEILAHLTEVIRGQVTEKIATNSGKVITLPVSENDRLRACDMMLKVQGAYREKIDVKVSSSTLFIQTLEKISSEIEQDLSS